MYKETNLSLSKSKKISEEEFSYRKNSFLEPKKPLELWALAAPRLGQVQDRDKRWTHEGDVLAVGQRTQCTFLPCRVFEGHAERVGGFD